MTVIDFHAHAFPDALAERAMPQLEEEGHVKAVLDGKIGSLLASMDAAGVDASVVASIATRPKQFQPILEWSRSIASTRLIPFPSFHPDDPEAAARVGEIAAAGFAGVKLHPYYQGFALDEERMWPIYEAFEHHQLLLLCHCGFDIAFPRERRCDPVRIRRVLDRCPRLRLVAAHLGSWEDWDEVELHLLGRPVFMDLATTIDWLGPDRTKAFLERHPPGHVVFGTDSPWFDQSMCVAQVRQLGLEPALERAVLGETAMGWLDGVLRTS